MITRKMETQQHSEKLKKEERKVVSETASTISNHKEKLGAIYLEFLEQNDNFSDNSHLYSIFGKKLHQ